MTPKRVDEYEEYCDERTEYYRDPDNPKILHLSQHHHYYPEHQQKPIGFWGGFLRGFIGMLLFMNLWDWLFGGRD